jgi:hypothetical protein
MGTGGSFPDRGVKLSTHLRLMPNSKNALSYTSSPSMRIHGVLLS